MIIQKTKYVSLIAVVFLGIVLNIESEKATAEEKESAGQKIVTLNKFVTDACKNDITFQEILIDNLKLAYLKDLNLVSGDIVLSLKNQYNVSLKDSDTNGYAGTVSLSKLFPDTGTEVSGSFDTRPDSLGNRASTFSAMISQPIAQNAFGYVNRLEERIQELDKDLAKHQIVEAYEDYFASLIVLYYQWYSDYYSLNSAASAFEESTKLLNNIKAKKRLNVAYQSDVDKINLQVIEKQENLYTLEGKYEKTLELICQAGGYKKELKYIPEFAAYLDREIQFDEEYLLFMNSGRTYKVLSIISEKGSAEVKKNANALLPSVNILFGYSNQRSGSSSINPEEKIYAGFSVDFSFWQQKNKAAYDISRIEENKTSLSSENLKQKLKMELKNIFSRIQLEKTLIQSAESKIMLGERIVKSGEKDYQLARIQLSELIQSINDLENYKNNKAYHTVMLQTLNIEWLRLLDKLVSKEDTGIK